jgi:stage II sporulation protein D
MRFNILIVSILFAANICMAQSINIAIFNDKKINSIAVNIKQGRYRIKSGNETLGEYKKGSIFHISRFGTELEIRDKRNFIGNFKKIEFVSVSDEGVLNAKPINPICEAREYDDNLILSCAEKELQIINKIDMEKYIASVIEAEGGNSAPDEYYKAQAVLIRTFTIKNMYKHAEEGFNLCDGVHCQAYKGRLTQHNSILTAARSTAGKVITDNESVIIMSPFHSNCGGETCTAGQYWQKDLPYLQSVKDPFCLKSSYAVWTTTIERKTWINYINNSVSNNVNYQNYNFTFQMPHRTKFIIINGIELNMRSIREYFHLKSAFFSVKDTGKEILITGKGYGHGIGMCQQGAMEMARVGYTWLDIIHFYFRDVQVVDYKDLDLHRFQPE